MSPIIAEILGTLFLVLLGNAVVANVVLKNTKGNNSGWMVITTGWALAVFVGVVIAGPFSGAHLNPAVTLAMAISGSFLWANVLPYLFAQVFGAMIGSTLVWLIYKDHFDCTEDSGSKLAAFCTAPSIRSPMYNLIAETVGAFVLVFTLFHISGAKVISQDTPIGLGSVGAIPISFLVWAIGLSLGGTTGYAINPARDFGPRVMHTILPIKNKGASDWSYAWIPITGPITGAILATFSHNLCHYKF